MLQMRYLGMSNSTNLSLIAFEYSGKLEQKEQYSLSPPLNLWTYNKATTELKSEIVKYLTFLRKVILFPRIIFQWLYGAPVAYRTGSFLIARHPGPVCNKNIKSHKDHSVIGCHDVVIAGHLTPEMPNLCFKMFLMLPLKLFTTSGKW